MSESAARSSLDAVTRVSPIPHATSSVSSTALNTGLPASEHNGSILGHDSDDAGE